MKIGFITSNPEKGLDFAIVNEFPHIEIDSPFFHSSNSRPNIGGRGIGLSFHAPLELSLAVKLDYLLTANINYYKRMIDLAQETRAEWITLHLGSYLSYFQSEQEALERSVLSLRELVAYAEKKRVILAVENFRASGKKTSAYLDLGTKIDDFERIFTAISSNYLKMCFDIGHANIASQDPLSYLQRFREKIYSVHVHDNTGITDDHLVCGEGMIQWGRFIQELNRIGFDGKMIIENGESAEHILASRRFLEQQL